MKAYGEDLRNKVINYIEKGNSRKEACEIFGVCLRSVTKWIKLKKETGSLSIEHVLIVRTNCLKKSS
jgi:transposase